MEEVTGDGRDLYKEEFQNSHTLLNIITVVAGHSSREVACFLFARSETVTVGSNPTQGMDV
jgi:hypothetical protein